MTLREELLALAAEDFRVRAELEREGTLFGGYHPRMEAVHRANAERLTAILELVGWPTAAKVGEDGARAAWILAMHAIGDPPLQRRCLDLLGLAAAEGKADKTQWAALFDRIRFNEGKPQRFGLIFDWDDDGRMGPGPVEEPETVDARRAELGLGTLAQAVEKHLEAAKRNNEKPPQDLAAYREKRLEWAKKTGWVA